MTPRSIARTLESALTNGHPAIEFDDVVCLELKVKKATADDIWALRYYLGAARRRLEGRRITTVLVTRKYFTDYYNDGKEPRSRAEAIPCVAMHFQPAAGIRLMTLGDAKNDIIGITFNELSANTGAGKISKIIQRITIELVEGHITPAKAASFFKYALAYKQLSNPEYAEEFARFLKAHGIKLIQSRE